MCTTEEDLEAVERLVEGDRLVKALDRICRSTYAASFRHYVAQFLGRRCLLLRAARQVREEVNDDCNRLLKLLDDNKWGAFAAERPVLQARARVVQAALGNLSSHDLETKLSEAIEKLGRYWNYDWFFEPPAEQFLGGNLPAVRKAFRDQDTFDLFGRRASAVGPGGWLHPGLLAVAESYAYVLGDLDLESAGDQVETYVLLAVDPAPAPWGGDQGYLARLKVEKVAGGCGAVYPHPLTSSALATDRAFQEGVQNAWWAAGERERGKIGPDRQLDFDARWTLEVRDPDSRQPLDVKVTGRSGEVAMACALQALRGHGPLYETERLDDRVAVTAQFAEPRKEVMRLTKVGLVTQKAAARELWPADGAMPHLSWLLVAGDQPERGDTWCNGRLELVGVPDFDAAYHRLAYWSEMTRKAKKAIAERAEMELAKLCQASAGYVKSPIMIHTGQARRAADQEPHERGSNDPDRQRLTETEYTALTTGVWNFHAEAAPASGTRIRGFFADSGVGKTTFLVHCEQQMAAAGHNLMPIRLELKDDRTWGDPSACLTGLVNHFHGVLNNEYRVKDVRKWLEELRTRGSVVLLLDAYDQTGSKSAKNLTTWLRQTGGVHACQAYITGRPWTRNEDVFSDAEICDVERLDIEQIRTFLTEELEQRYRTLLRDDELLRTPLVLSQLKELRNRPDRRLQNRHDVYRAFIEEPFDKGTNSEGLISKGLRTAKNSPFRQPNVQNIGGIARIYGVTAWSMLTEFDGYRGYVADTEYQRPYTELRRKVDEFANAQFTTQPSVLPFLRQINVVKDESSDSLEWRHPSFGEYFAGCHLTRLDRDALRAFLEEALDNVKAIHRIRSADADDDVDNRPPLERWRWVFRFALSRLHADREQRRLDALVEALVAHGDPFVVYESMQHDSIEPSERLSHLVCWLVHQTVSLTSERDMTKAMEGRSGLPAIDCEALRLVQGLLRREYRQGPVLAPAWELVVAGIKSQDDDVKQLAETIAKEFAGELPAAEEVVLTNLLERGFMSCPGERAGETDGLKPWGDGRHFVFPMGEKDKDGDKDAPHHWVRIERFAITSFTVRNAELELLDPSHYWLRDEYSRADDQPALYVNWHLADLYCRVWLALQSRRLGRDETYGLPTECQAEFAIRGGTASRYWWGKEFDSKRCNTDRQVRWTLTREETLAAGTRYQNGYGVYHASGDAWIWCADWYEADHYGKRTAIGRIPEGLAADGIDRVYAADGGPSERGSLRVFRGGSWFHDSEFCRSASRSRFWPGYRNDNLGFRVARSPSGQDG